MSTKTLLVIASLSVVMLAAILAYGYEQIKNENELASTLQNKSDALTEANSVAESIRAARDKAAPDLATLDQITLTQSELVPFIELIESTGKSMGLSVAITTVSSDPVVKATNTASSTPFQPPQPIHIVLTADGSWSSSFGFVHALENLPQRVKVDSLSMTVTTVAASQSSTSTDSVSSGKWHTAASITIFSFNQ